MIPYWEEQPTEMSREEFLRILESCSPIKEEEAEEKGESEVDAY